MQSQQRIRQALDRNVRALERRASLGRGTATTTARVTDGFTCVVEEGRFRLVADMTEKYGGADEGPNPGVYGRAALASCLAIGYVMHASRAGLEIDALEVQIEADYDVRPELGMTHDQPGYDQVRYTVSVDSPADEDDVLRLLDFADAHSPWLAVFTKPVDVRREVRIRSRAAAAAAAAGADAADEGATEAST